MTPRSDGAPCATQGATGHITLTSPAAAKRNEATHNSTDGAVATRTTTWIRHGLNGSLGDRQEVTTAEKFEAFIGANPRFVDELVARARQFRDHTGHSCSVQMLIESARFDYEVTTVTDDGLKINNSFAPYFSRLLMARESDLAGFFKLRKAPEADRWIDAVTAGRWAA